MLVPFLGNESALGSSRWQTDKMFIHTHLAPEKPPPPADAFSGMCGFDMSGLGVGTSIRHVFVKR